MKKDIFIEKLISLLWELDFSQDVKNEAIDYIFKNYELVKEHARQAYSGDWNSYLLKLDPYLCLMILIYSVVDLEELYDKEGLPKIIMMDSLSDLTLRQKMYMNEHKCLGLTEEDISWLKRIYFLQIFKLKALQYEFGIMDYQECDKDSNISEISKKIPKGCPILKVHIMRGVDLTEKSVDESLAFSKVFFKTYFPDYDYKGYTCNSWMLYSENHRILSDKSNILNFSKRFEPICGTDRADMAIKYIFGKEYENTADYPQDTSLQRNALENLEHLGVGFGIIFKEEI